MKTSGILILFLFFSFTGMSQSIIQIAPGITLGNYIGADFRVNWRHNDELSFEIGVNSLTRKYRSAGARDNIFGKPKYARQSISALELLVGKIIPQDIEKYSKLNLKAGIVLSKVVTPIEWEWNGAGYFFGWYGMRYNTQNTLGLLLEPSVEIPVSTHTGISFTPFVLLTKPSVAFGFRIHLLFGWQL